MQPSPNDTGPRSPPGGSTSWKRHIVRGRPTRGRAIPGPGRRQRDRTAPGAASRTRYKGAARGPGRNGPAPHVAGAGEGGERRRHARCPAPSAGRAARANDQELRAGASPAARRDRNAARQRRSRSSSLAFCNPSMDRMCSSVSDWMPSDGARRSSSSDSSWFLSSFFRASFASPAHLPHGGAALFGQLVHEAGHFLAPFVGQRRNRDPDHAPVVARG